MDQYAVMGNPIAHSKSPAIHSMFAQQTGEALEYTAILVPPGEFESAVRLFVDSGGRGLNITVPFKQDAWALVDRRSVPADKAGAVNTIAVQDDGSLYGANTDGLGIVRDIEQNQKMNLRGKSILLLGAGGAVRGVLSPVLACQPEVVVIANRTVGKADELVHIFSDEGSVQSSGFDQLPRARFDVVINGTAASLQGDVPPSPSAAVANAVCYDMMYGAHPTAFMQWALRNGAASVCDGLGMLVEQAAESFYIWRGVRPDTTSVIQKLRASLS